MFCKDAKTQETVFYLIYVFYTTYSALKHSGYLRMLHQKCGGNSPRACLCFLNNTQALKLRQSNTRLCLLDISPFLSSANCLQRLDIKLRLLVLCHLAVAKEVNLF